MHEIPTTSGGQPMTPQARGKRGPRRPGLRRRRVGLLAAALLLGGCAARPGGPATPSSRGGGKAAPGSPSAAAGAAPLAGEAAWLRQWFEGTPVRVGPGGGGTLVVEVPLAHAFDPGQARIRPALAAVLDKVAESLRRQPRAHVATLAAPADAGGGAALALQRAHQVRLHLLQRGVAPTRLMAGTLHGGPAVHLRLAADDTAG